MRLFSRFWANTAVFLIGMTLVIVASGQPEIRPSLYETLAVITLSYLGLMTLVECLVEIEGGFKG